MVGAEREARAGKNKAEKNWDGPGRNASGIGHKANADMHHSLKALSAFLLARTVPPC